MVSNRCKAFTLVEMMVVIAIVLAVAGISYPIWASAKEKGNETVTINALRQTWVALELYRQDQSGGAALSGTSSEMGLPNQDQFIAAYDKLGIKRWTSGRIAEIHYYPRDFSDIPIGNPGQGEQLVQQWVGYTQREQGSSVVFGDFSHTEDCPNLINFTCLFSGFGVDLGGALHRKLASGNNFICIWWEQ